ncbi:MAG: hypothetical protein ABJC13_02980 [Acidobacteriota bacterium]
MSFRVSRFEFRPFGLFLLVFVASACRPAEQAEAAPAPDPPFASADASAEARAGSPASSPASATDPAKVVAGTEILRSGEIALRVSSGDPHRAELAELAADLDRSLHSMAARLPYAGPLGALGGLGGLGALNVEIAVEPDFTAQARATGAVGEAVAGGRADLTLVFDPADREAYRFAVAHRLLARSALPALPPGIADGAALWLAAGTWYGRPFEEWLGPLARAGAFPSAAELLAVDRPRDASRLLATPVAAAWIDRRPGKTLAEKLGGGLPEPAALGSQLAALAGRAAGMASGATPKNALALAAGSLGPSRFLRGVSFAMLNSIDGGYHAPSVDREYARLSGLGADSVSLMPFAFERDPHAPGLAFLGDHPSSETDVGLIHAARRAHAQGLSVLWKPHLWVGHDSWPGEIEMRDEASWAQWWSGYRRYVLHHAMLAAWTQAELFCVGVELDRTAIGPERERSWRELIAAVRAIFPGQVTYAANWDRAPEIPFWDALDFVGVDAYYPLAAGDQATDADLDRGAQEVVGRLARIAQKARRPLLLTEVGFSARRAAWREPNAEGGDLDEQDQLRAYRALLTALGRRPWLAGVFVWKSFSDESAAAQRSGRADFRFLGRPAEAAVRDFFALGTARSTPPGLTAPHSKGTP